MNALRCEPTFLPTEYTQAILVTTSSTTETQYRTWMEVLTGTFGLCTVVFSLSRYGAFGPKDVWMEGEKFEKMLEQSSQRRKTENLNENLTVDEKAFAAAEAGAGGEGADEGRKSRKSGNGSRKSTSGGARPDFAAEFLQGDLTMLESFLTNKNLLVVVLDDKFDVDRDVKANASNLAVQGWATRTYVAGNSATRAPLGPMGAPTHKTDNKTEKNMPTAQFTSAPSFLVVGTIINILYSKFRLVV